MDGIEAQIRGRADESQSGSDDRRLVSDVLAKDRKATAEFVSRCADWIYPFVRRRLKPQTAFAEDLTQEILLAAWQNLANFRGESSLRAWILGIARHKVEDYYRKRIGQMELQDDYSADAAAVAPLLDEQLDSRIRQRRVEAALQDLPETYALALLWRYRDNRSAREMAQLTGKTEKAIERLLARARASFRKRWEDARS